MKTRRNASAALLRAVGRYVKATHPDEIEYAIEEGRGTSDLAMGRYAYEQHDAESWAELVAHVTATARRSNPGFLGTLGLMGGAFVGGLVVERQRGYARKAETEARGLIATAKKAVASPFEKKPAPKSVKRSTSTDPVWVREESPDGKGYSHLRTINGVDYEIWERIYSDGSKAIFLEVGGTHERVLAPNGEQNGWASVTAAKRAAEALAGLSAAKKNPSRRRNPSPTKKFSNTPLTAEETKRIGLANVYLMDWVVDGWGPLPARIAELEAKPTALTNAEKRELIDWFYRNAPGDWS